MTQVIKPMTRDVRMALALETKLRVDFKRSDIMTIRRMARDGVHPQNIMKYIGFAGHLTTFRKLCKRYQIRLGRVTPRYFERY